MDKPFDLISELGFFSRKRKISLRDPATISEFFLNARNKAKQAVEDDALLHGQRTEAMFEALLVSLGQFRLLKAEDSGRLFPEELYIAPDFRVVLSDGAHWLVEVKNVYCRDPLWQRRRLCSHSYLSKLASYAEATGADLKIAIFWARWSIWTLVSPDRLASPAGDLDIDLQTALLVNELSSLGDRTIGTRAPLRLRVVMDPQLTSAVDADGNVLATIDRVELFCGDERVTEPVEQEAAWVFIQYGDWQEDGHPEAILDGARLTAIDFRWDPVEKTGQGFEFVGTLSQMFARYYIYSTHH